MATPPWRRSHSTRQPIDCEEFMAEQNAPGKSDDHRRDDDPGRGDEHRPPNVPPSEPPGRDVRPRPSHGSAS